VLWKITPYFAEWIASPDNIMFQTSVLSPQSSVLELGCGISGVVGLVLSPLIGCYVATDQDNVMRMLNQNISENTVHPSTLATKRRKSHSKQAGTSSAQHKGGIIETRSLDWETDMLSPEFLVTSGASTTTNTGFDVVLACDCIYNAHLITPFVRMCVDACSLRSTLGPIECQPSVCVVAQQLRSPDIFEEWLQEFHKHFRVWRVPDKHLTAELQAGTGFTVHLGILRPGYGFLNSA
jgi:hypothetical protein